MSKDNKASKKRLFKVLGTAWQETQKEDWDDPGRKLEINKDWLRPRRQ